MAISDMSIDDIITPESREEYGNEGKANFLSTSKYRNRTPGLFKAKLQGRRMIALTCKCYYAKDAKLKPKLSCKGMSRKQNPMSWERYIKALHGRIDMAVNAGFCLLDQGIVTYTQDKLGLSPY